MNTRFHWQWKSFWVSNIIRWLPQGDKVKIPAFIIYVRLEERQLYGLPLQRQLRPEGWAVSVYASHFEVEAGTAIVVLSENGTICHKSRLMTSGHSKVTGCTLLLSGQSLCHQEYVRDLVIMKKKSAQSETKSMLIHIHKVGKVAVYLVFFVGHFTSMQFWCFFL